MKRRPSAKRRATLSDSSDEYVTSQIDRRREPRRKPIEYVDSPVADEPPTWERDEDAELEFAGSPPRR
jgi:hypothetical protein